MNPIYFFGAVLIIAGLSIIGVARHFEKPAPSPATYLLQEDFKAGDSPTPPDGWTATADTWKFDKLETNETLYFVSYSANTEDGLMANGMDEVKVANSERNFKTLVDMCESIRKKHNFKPNSVVITNLLKP